MISKATQFFEWIDEQRHEIIIPSVVISEILVPESIPNYSKYLEIINKNFRVVNFDVFAATKYAQILNGRFGEMKELARENGIRREKMKIDHQVIACALIGGANSIYTYDKGLRAFAQGLIDVKELPPARRVQQSLFDNDALSSPKSESEGSDELVEESDIIRTPSMSNEPLPEKENKADFPAVDKVLGEVFSDRNKPKLAPENKENNNNEQSNEESSTETPPGELPTEAGD